MEIPQISLCKDAVGLDMALEGRLLLEDGLLHSSEAKHLQPINSTPSNSQKKKLLIYLFEAGGATVAVKETISAFVIIFPMLSSSSSTSPTLKHLGDIRSKIF